MTFIWLSWPYMDIEYDVMSACPYMVIREPLLLSFRYRTYYVIDESPTYIWTLHVHLYGGWPFVICVAIKVHWTYYVIDEWAFVIFIQIQNLLRNQWVTDLYMDVACPNIWRMTLCYLCSRTYYVIDESALYEHEISCLFLTTEFKVDPLLFV